MGKPSCIVCVAHSRTHTKAEVAIGPLCASILAPMKMSSSELGLNVMQVFLYMLHDVQHVSNSV